MNIQQMNMSGGPPQFIRATRPQWQGNQPMPQRQLIHLDAQTHAHVQSLDPGARAEYLSKLHKRNLLVRQQVDNKSLPTSEFASNLVTFYDLCINCFVLYFQTFSSKTI